MMIRALTAQMIKYPVALLVDAIIVSSVLYQLATTHVATIARLVKSAQTALILHAQTVVFLEYLNSHLTYAQTARMVKRHLRTVVFAKGVLGVDSLQPTLPRARDAPLVQPVEGVNQHAHHAWRVGTQAFNYMIV